MSNPHQTTQENVAETAAMLKALGEPNRLRIFIELMNGDTCNCELVDRLDMPANLLSHHLKVLTSAGLVKARRDKLDGRWIYFSINRAVVSAWQARLDQLFDPSRLEERVLCGPEGRCGAVERSRALSGISGE